MQHSLHWKLRSETSVIDFIHQGTEGQSLVVVAHHVECLRLGLALRPLDEVQRVLRSGERRRDERRNDGHGWSGHGFRVGVCACVEVLAESVGLYDFFQDVSCVSLSWYIAPKYSILFIAGFIML